MSELAGYSGVKRTANHGYNYTDEEAKRMKLLREEQVAETKRVREVLRAEVGAARAAQPEPEPFVPSGTAQEYIARQNAYRYARRGRRGRSALRTAA
jgi:hypothetical protein